MACKDPLRFTFVSSGRYWCQATALWAGLLAFGAPAAATAADAGPPEPGAPPASNHLAPYHLASPDGRIEVTVSGGARLSYDVRFQGKTMLAGATLSLDVDHRRLGIAPQITRVERQSVARQIQPVVRQKAAVLEDKFNELRLVCAGGYVVAFRAYDQGVAYRFETALPKAEVKIYGEEATFAFAGSSDAGVYFPQEESFFSHNERKFQRVRFGSIVPTALASLPAIVETAAGPKIAIAESDIEDYPGLWLRGTGGPALVATFPPYPLEEKALNDRNIKVTRAADYIAVTRGTRTYPWRVLGVAPQDRDLVSSTLVYLLESPSRIADTSWIRPGKVAWDWWNALNLQGVDFQPGVNTQTYEYYIDFAARYGIEYVILDEGWYPFGNLLKTVPAIDMPRILAYAKKKNVGVILWVIWKTFDDQFQPALDQFARWGVKGLKVDFMQRDDQVVMRFYQRVCRELAKRKMLVDFHGGIRPALMTRTWPNLISTEGVQGLEHMKWSNASDPEHNLSLPFTRMFLGPMDYTPGAMLNADRQSFKINFKEPMSLGTRCQQLAMYVVFESPLQMLADSPTHYLREPEAMEFLGPVPSVWDETRVLDGTIGDFIVVARRHGRDWYLGAMTDWTPRSGTVDLSFLGAGTFQMTTYEDGPDAERRASDYRKNTVSVDKTSHVTMKLASGGGWVARIQPKGQTQ
jgi:alpha-glucosidase